MWMPLFSVWGQLHPQCRSSWAEAKEQRRYRWPHRCEWDFKMKPRSVTGMCQSWQVHLLARHGDSSRKTMAALLCLPRPRLQLSGQTAWQRLCQLGTCEPPEEEPPGFLWARCTIWQPTTASLYYVPRLLHAGWLRAV